MSGDLHKPWLVKELMVSEHAVDRFRVRAKRHDKDAYLPLDMSSQQIEALMRVAMLERQSDSCLVLEDGAALRWIVPMPRYKAQMVVRPWTAEGPPIVLTVLTDEMRKLAFEKRKYKGVQP
jgi:hypothetical protein